jgi:hypothetical protein
MISIFKIVKNKSYLIHNKTFSLLNQNVIDSVQSIFGQNNYSITDSVRVHYSKDESLHE